MQRPLIPFLVALMLGITIGNFFQVPDRILLVLLLITFVALFIASIKKSNKLIPLLVILCSIFLGILNINFYLYQDYGPKHIVNYISKEKVNVEGIVSESPQVSSDRAEIVVSVTRIIEDDTTIPVEGHVLLTVRDNQDVKYGDFIRFKTRLRAPHSYQNPGGFDFEKHLRYRGILVRGFIKDSSGIVVVRENQGNIFKLNLERFRNNLKTFIEENSPSPESEIIQAMILGNQKEIPKEVMEKFNKTGTTHIIAISGFNIGIVAFISFFAIRFIMKSSTYLLLKLNIIKISSIFGIIPVIFYTFIAGMGISVVRASIMAVTFMIAIILGKDRDLYNTLGLSALIILIISPYSLFDVSFQLSFAAVLAILFIVPKLTLTVHKGNIVEEQKITSLAKKIFKNIYLFLIVSVAATLGTLPLIIFYFNRVSTIVLLSNLIVVPVMGIIAIPFCMAIIIAVPLSHTLALLFLNIAYFLVRISILLVDFFASLPGSSFFVITPTFIEIGAYYLFLIVAVKLIDIWRDKKTYNAFTHQWYRISFAALAVFFTVDTIYLYVRDISNENLQATFIDVGQGSSTLIALPTGKRILIDGGGSYENIFDIGKYVIAPFLWRERIHTIDIVVLSHPHPDHLNGLLYILSNFNVKEVWTNGEKGESETYKDFEKIIKEKRIEHRVVSEKTGEKIIHGVKIRVFNPLHAIDVRNNLPRKFNITNDDSIVLKFTFGNVSFLLPADISEPSESCLVKSGKDIKSQVMLVPHHGGFTSSTIPFLKRVLPEIAVVSCGRENVFHDPNPDVVKRYSKLGIRLLRTDINGAVRITTDGRSINYNVFK